MTDSQIPKTACLAEGLMNILLRKTEGLADFGEILVFTCVALKTKRICLPRLVIVYSTGNLVFVRVNLKPFIVQCLKLAALKNFVFDWEMRFHSYEGYRFQKWVGLELPIKHTPNTIPSLRSLLFSEFGKFGIANRTHPKCKLEAYQVFIFSEMVPIRHTVNFAFQHEHF